MKASNDNWPINAALPPYGFRGRWNWRRKAAVLRELDAGRLGFNEACVVYGLSPEELREWLTQRAKGGGERGLSLKGVRYRRKRSRAS